jgi:RsiW-degrading membrane proteinase PrsW (M82 family)
LCRRAGGDSDIVSRNRLTATTDAANLTIMIFGGRARWQALSRDRDWLKRTALAMVACGFATALLLTAFAPGRGAGFAPDPVEQALRAEWQALRRQAVPPPRALVAWLARVCLRADHLRRVQAEPDPDWTTYQGRGELFDWATAPLLASLEPATRRLLEDFLQAWLDTPQEGGAAARQRLEAAGRRDAEFANELLGTLHLRAHEEAAALVLLLREGLLFETATAAREAALRLALRRRDVRALAAMAAAPGWLEEIPPLLQHHAGTLLGDFTLQWRGLLRHRLSHLPVGALSLAGLAALLWCLVLVLQGPGEGRRWFWPLAPLLAGVLSIAPALSLAGWQEVAHGISAEAPFPQDLWYYVGGVGLREELSKLVAGALFLPWLLWQRVPGRALFTGAFVGLGFALEENLSYFEQYGGGVAVVRFLTANFMHAALSGPLLQALYLALRSRFVRVDGFLVTLPSVVVVHGVYDYAAAADTPGLDLLAMAILALTAWQFLDLAEQEARPGRRWLSPGAVVVLGTALLIAWSLIATALQSADRARLAAAGMECLAVLPLVFIYWRRLGAS